MGKRIVSARLRDKKDDDIRKALSALPVYYDESDIVREALRQFLFSHKGRKPEILGSQIELDMPDELAKELELIDSSEESLDKSLDEFIGS